MIWIRKLLGLCDHRWETVSAIKIFGDTESGRPVGVAFLQKCSRCGVLRQERVMS